MFVSELGQDIANPSNELSNWDFLQDLELVPEPDQFVPSVSQAAGTGLVSADNTKEKNRLAQKRFRQRKKVHPHHALSDHCSSSECFVLTQERDQTTEAQLAETTSELRNLRLKQRELEARNNLLEKVASLSKQQSSQNDPASNRKAQTGSVNTAQVLHFYITSGQASTLRMSRPQQVLEHS